MQVKIILPTATAMWVVNEGWESEYAENAVEESSDEHSVSSDDISTLDTT